MTRLSTLPENGQKLIGCSVPCPVVSSPCFSSLLPYHPHSCALIPACCFPPAADVPYTLPPQGPDADVLLEMQAHCKEPLFLRSELAEWEQVHHQESAEAASPTPIQIRTMFHSLTPHSAAASQLDNSLTCFQTRVQVAARRNPQDALPFTFTAGLWVAVRPDEDETMEQFWIGKIITVKRTCLIVHWWDKRRDGWHDNHTTQSISHNCVLACGFEFNPAQGVSPQTLCEIYSHY